MQKVRFYTVEKMLAPGDVRQHFWLVSYDTDVIQLDDVRTPADVVRKVQADKNLPYALFTMEEDPEYGYSMPNRFLKYRTRHRALVLWSRGRVLDLPGTRPFN